MNSLWLDLRCVAAVRFGLHGFGTLRDETLPPGGTEASEPDEAEQMGEDKGGV